MVVAPAVLVALLRTTMQVVQVVVLEDIVVTADGARTAMQTQVGQRGQAEAAVAGLAPVQFAAVAAGLEF
jgi:hypothetical protein